jgi:hypothetical protein
MPKTKKSTETKPEAARTEETPTPTPAVSLGGTPVVTLPRFNPHTRPAVTEHVSTTPIRQSYESIQQEAQGPGVAEWRAADEARAKLTELYRSLQEDARYAEAYKSETAWREYEKVRAQVVQLAPTAREKMLKSADNLERLSIPNPEGESLITKDVDKLLLTDHAYNRLVGLLDRAEKQAGKGPFRRDPHDILKAEYERGFDEGGPGGGATVRAIVGIARDFGFDLDKIVEGRRKDYHYESLEDAARARMRSQLVGRSVPQPPFEHPDQLAAKRTGAGSVGTYGGGQRAFVPGKGTSNKLFQKKPRGSHWK